MLYGRIILALVHQLRLLNWNLPCACILLKTKLEQFILTPFRFLIFMILVRSGLSVVSKLQKEKHYRTAPR